MNASETETTRPTRTCPTWCVQDYRMDAGTPDECVIHMGAQRYVEGLKIDLHQTEFMDGVREQPFLYIDDAEMSEAAAVSFAAELLSLVVQVRRTARGMHTDR